MPHTSSRAGFRGRFLIIVQRRRFIADDRRCSATPTVSTGKWPIGLWFPLSLRNGRRALGQPPREPEDVGSLTNGLKSAIGFDRQRAKEVRYGLL